MSNKKSLDNFNADLYKGNKKKKSIKKTNQLIKQHRKKVANLDIFLVKSICHGRGFIFSISFSYFVLQIRKKKSN